MPEFKYFCPGCRRRRDTKDKFFRHIEELRVRLKKRAQARQISKQAVTLKKKVVRKVASGGCEKRGSPGGLRKGSGGSSTAHESPSGSGEKAKALMRTTQPRAKKGSPAGAAKPKEAAPGGAPAVACKSAIRC